MAPAGPPSPHRTPAEEAGVSASPHAGSAAHIRERRLAEAGLLGTALIWSGNFVVAKAAVGALGPLTFTSARYVIASATLFLLVRWRMGAIRSPAGQAVPLLLLGVLGFGIYQLLWTVGLTKITAGDSALLIAASPVLTALLAGILGMDRLTPPKLGGALVAFGGVAIVVVAGHGIALGTSLAGDLLTLGAAVLWAVYTVMGTRMLRRVDPLQAIAWSVLGGTLVLIPFGAWQAITSPPTDISLGTILGVIYSGTLAAGTANVLVFNAIRIVGPTRATVSQLLVPAGAVILGVVFLAEPLGIAQVVGGAIIVGGLWLTRRASVVPASVRARLGFPA